MTEQELVIAMTAKVKKQEAFLARIREEAEQEERKREEERKKARQLEFEQDKAAKKLQPLVCAMLGGWASTQDRAMYLSHIIPFSIKHVRDGVLNGSRDFFYYTVSLSLVKNKEAEPLTKLQSAMVYAEAKCLERHVELEGEGQANASEMLEECEKELDDKPSLTPWWLLVGMLTLYWYFTK